MAKCYKIQGNKLIFENNGRNYIDDEDKKHIRGSFTVIEFPACYNKLYDDDFDACKNQLAKITTLDFTKALNIKNISDGTFTGAKSLEAVVLPKNVEYVNEFKQCPKLKEIHIYNLKKLYSITNDKDKRLTIYASEVRSDLSSFADGFLADVGVLYVPAKDIPRLKEALDRYHDELDIRPLPEGYSFPTEALFTSWQQVHGGPQYYSFPTEALSTLWQQVYDGPQYHCVLAGQSFGPVTISQFANMKRFGIVDGNTLVWKEGMANWAIASTVADLQILM